MTQSVRLKIIENMNAAIESESRLQRDPIFMESVKSSYAEYGFYPTSAELLKISSNKMKECRQIILSAEGAKTIVFPAGQAEIFRDAMNVLDFGLDYILPFRDTLLQFSEPILIDVTDVYSFSAP